MAVPGINLDSMNFFVIRRRYLPAALGTVYAYFFFFSFIKYNIKSDKYSNRINYSMLNRLNLNAIYIRI